VEMLHKKCTWGRFHQNFGAPFPYKKIWGMAFLNDF
jgi:hypothetical protein